jgi:uncharacterized membrane protein
MEPHFIEWLNLAIRWVHVITGIAWIGASFYFVWLENNLQRQVNDPSLAGELWAIHGGGIYHLQKYRLAPPAMPERLHWFKWEAYATWLTGILLLVVVYYLNASAYLVLPGGPVSAMTAVALGIASLVAGWLVYDGLCNSSLRHQPMLLGIVLVLLLVLAAWALSQFMSGRGTYIHIGAIIGTMMVGNVFFVIMPAQRHLVEAIEAGREPDPDLPKIGLLRSRHNNYLTLPVLFIMVSNHFPSTYGSGYNWLILAVLSLLSVGVRHYFNTRHQSQHMLWALPAAALGLMVLAFITSPQKPLLATIGNNVQVKVDIDIQKVQQIIAEHCTVCHGANPSHEAFAVAPGGVLLDTPEQMQRQASRIYQQAVATHIMPLGNMTGMTEMERELLGQWIIAGAPLMHE